MLRMVSVILWWNTNSLTVHPHSSESFICIYVFSIWHGLILVKQFCFLFKQLHWWRLNGSVWPTPFLWTNVDVIWQLSACVYTCVSFSSSQCVTVELLGVWMEKRWGNPGPLSNRTGTHNDRGTNVLTQIYWQTEYTRKRNFIPAPPGDDNHIPRWKACRYETALRHNDKSRSLKSSPFIDNHSKPLKNDDLGAVSSLFFPNVNFYFTFKLNHQTVTLSWPEVCCLSPQDMKKYINLW